MRISDLDKATMVGFVDDNSVVKALHYAETGTKPKGLLHGCGMKPCASRNDMSNDSYACLDEWC